MRQRTATSRAVTLVLAVAVLSACGGEDAASTAAGGADDPTEAHGPPADSTPSAPADSAAPAAAVKASLTAVAAQTASALSGPDWGAVYDLSCRALLREQSREDYTAALGAAGSPAQLAGGTLTAGSTVGAEGVDAAELPPTEGEVRWVQMRQGEDVVGIARFVDAGDGFQYCGLGQ